MPQITVDRVSAVAGSMSAATARKSDQSGCLSGDAETVSSQSGGLARLTGRGSASSRTSRESRPAGRLQRRGCICERTPCAIRGSPVGRDGGVSRPSGPVPGSRGCLLPPLAPMYQAWGPCQWQRGAGRNARGAGRPQRPECATRRTECAATRRPCPPGGASPFSIRRIGPSAAVLGCDRTVASATTAAASLAPDRDSPGAVSLANPAGFGETSSISSRCHPPRTLRQRLP
jgi:hypothetical protein